MPTQTPSVATFKNPELANLAPSLPSLTDKAAFWLKRDIVRGVFLPNERLKVDALSKFYGIGRSPVQAAIMQLEPSGLLSHEHQKGYRVATMSLPDFDDVRELYRELYEIALRKAVLHGDQAWEERMIVTLHRTSKIAKVIEGRGEARELWQLAYKRLHGAILSGCGSPLLLTLITDLGNRLERYIETFGDMESDLKRDHHKEHGQLIDILLKRDPNRAVAAYEEFFQRNQPVRDTILEKLRKLEAAPKRGRPKPQRPEPRGRARQKATRRKRTSRS